MKEVLVWECYTLVIKEAAVYFRIGEGKVRGGRMPHKRKLYPD